MEPMLFKVEAYIVDQLHLIIHQGHVIESASTIHLGTIHIIFLSVYKHHIAGNSSLECIVNEHIFMNLVSVG